ncbi:MAG: hypothetical protein GXX85_08350 [Ignavibacteria bacterium]|mgnify:CR=1 FL=1|nr:hypothetical protein [Ignavibacteria bacterium]
MIISKNNIKNIDTDHLISDLINQNKIDNILFIVPTNRKLRNLKKQLIKECPGKTTSGITIETLTTLSVKLLKNLIPFSEASEAAMAVMLKTSINNLELGYFGGKGSSIPDGTLERIKNVISEYKKNLVSPEMLFREAEKLTPLEKRKAKDIALIYDSYIKSCKTLKSLEIGDIYRELIIQDKKLIKKSFESLFPKVKTAFISGFNQFYKPEIEIISYISDFLQNELFVNFDYYVNNQMIFSHLNECFYFFEKKGFRQVFDKSASPSYEFKNIIRENLFLKKNFCTDLFKEKVTLIESKNRVEEVELIAKEIKLLLKEGKTEPSEICVAFNLISNYSSFVRDIFSSYGIPLNLTDRIHTDSSQPVIALIKLLEILENDFYYKDILRIGYSGYFLPDKFNPKNLERICSVFGIVSGRFNWINKLKELILSSEFESESGEDYKGFSKEDYNSALHTICYIEKILKPFEKNLTYKEFILELEKLIIDSGFVSNILRHSGTKTEENIKALSLFFDTISEIFNLFASSENTPSKFPLQYFLDKLRLISSSSRFNVKEKSGYGVLVTSVEEIRGINAGCLFLGGMCDGDFPTRYQPEIFSSGSYFKQENIHLSEERYKFYTALNSWNKKLWLSYPASDGKTELEISSFIKDFLAIFECEKKDISHYKNYVLNYEEAGILFGKSALLNQEEMKNILSDHLPDDKNNILEKIKINKLRQQNDLSINGWNGYTGPIPNTEKQYSITQFETYAKCPFKFFAERILHLEIIEEPDEEAAGLEIGNFLHDILFDFFIELKAKNIKLAGCSDEEFSTAIKMLFNFAEKKLEKEDIFKSPMAFWDKEKIFGINRKIENSILYKFLLNERNDNTGFSPEYFETAFGSVYSDKRDELLSSDEPFEIEGVKLRGKIDRIEIRDNTVSVVDYKTGKANITKDDLYNGLSLQLPVYADAAVYLLQKKTGIEHIPYAMQIYSLKYSDKLEKKMVFPDKKSDPLEANRNLIDTVRKYIKQYSDSIQEGKFGLSALPDKEKKVCAYCNFKSICRVSDIN